MQPAAIRLVVLSLATLLALTSNLSIAAEADKKSPNGRWRLAEIEIAGKKIKAPEMAASTSVVIEGGKVKAYIGDKLMRTFTMTVDASKSPATYEMKADEPDRKGRIAINRGIFDIDDKGRLRMCFTDGERSKAPDSFDTTKTPGSQLTVYEPVK